MVWRGLPTGSPLPVEQGLRQTRKRTLAERVRAWPLLEQLGGDDRLALGKAARSARSAALRPRTEHAERVVQSVCPYCAVGCGQLVYVEGGEIAQIEGDPASPISRGRLCPKGAATRSFVQGPRREYRVKYRPPYATSWQELPLDRAMEMIAERVIATRASNWEERDEARGALLKRTMAIAALGGATLDNEENYLIKKLMVGLGVVQVENQARI